MSLFEQLLSLHDTVEKFKKSVGTNDQKLFESVNRMERAVAAMADTALRQAAADRGIAISPGSRPEDIAKALLAKPLGV